MSVLFCSGDEYAYQPVGEFEDAASSMSESDQEQPARRQKAKKPRKQPAASREPARKQPAKEASPVPPTRPSSKHEVFYFRFMGRMKMAWQIHKLHRQISDLQCELYQTKRSLFDSRCEYMDVKWALHEVTCGAGSAAIQLYKAKELLPRVPYAKRSRMGNRLWQALAEMKISQP